MVSFYIARSVKQAIHNLAIKRGETQADTLRALLAYSFENMPPKWKPAEIDNKGKR